jgi:hypothetical protein
MADDTEDDTGYDQAGRKRRYGYSAPSYYGDTGSLTFPDDVSKIDPGLIRRREMDDRDRAQEAAQRDQDERSRRYDLENVRAPKYSAVYGDEAKGEADYPTEPNPYTQLRGTPFQPTPGQAQPAYPPNAPQQSATGYPPEQLGMPFNLQDRLGQMGQEEGAAPPPIRTFAGNAETNQSVEQLLANDPAYQALGPVGKKKYEYLAKVAQNIRNSNMPVEKQYAPMHQVLAEMSQLVHTHEEGERSGAAKLAALHPSIANPSGQQQEPQQTPIFSESQKQQIGQLQQAQQRIMQEHAAGNLTDGELQQGLQQIQQAQATIKPIGMSGQKPNQPGTIHVDPQTGKAYTFNEKGVVEELDNQRTLTSLGQLPAHEAHKLVSETAAMYGETDQQAIARLTAREMMIRGQPVPPALLAQIGQGKAHKGIGEKAGPGEAPMTEDRFHAARDRAEAHLGKIWDADQQPATDTKPGGAKKLHPDREEFIHAELGKAGLVDDDGTLGKDYAGYLRAWNKQHGGTQQPGQNKAEPIGNPTEQPKTEQERFAKDKWPQIYDQAKKTMDGTTQAMMFRVPYLTKKANGNIMNLSPGDRGVYVQSMRAARKIDPSIPSFWDDAVYAQRIGAVLPQVKTKPRAMETWEP